MSTMLHAAILSAVLAAAAPAAHAQSLQRAPGDPTNAGPVAREILVSAHGLNLSAAGDADTFLRRLSAGVTRDCDDASGAGLARSHAFQACRDAALQEAIGRVRSPTVRRRFAELHMGGEAKIASR